MFGLIADVNSIVRDKNNQFYGCVKDIKVEQNDLDKMQTAENNISYRNICMNFKIL